MKKNSFTFASSISSPTLSSRRDFLKKSASVSVLAMSGVSLPIQAFSPFDKQEQNKLSANRVLFNGERRDPITHHYHLGNGYRMYNPSLMRFHALDSMSPFGQGGINGYAYCMGDPVNKRDPSGHFLIALLVMAIVGAVVGATIAAIAEGIRSAVTGDAFDWKAVAVGAAVGFVCGGIGFSVGAFAAGIGAATTLAKVGVFIGVALTNSATGSLVSMGINVAMGMNHNQAAFGALIGLGIGLVTAGLKPGFSCLKRAFSRYLQRSAAKLGGTALGTRYILYKGSAGDGSINSRRLLVTAHGRYEGGGTYKASASLDYFSEHGQKLGDPGLRKLCQGIYKPAETIIKGDTAYSYGISSYAKDMTTSTAKKAQHFGIDIIGVRPHWQGTTKHLEQTLAKNGMQYAQIEYSVCRAIKGATNIVSADAQINPAAMHLYPGIGL